MSTQQSKHGRRFDEECKREGAALASQPGAKIEQVAHDLGGERPQRGALAPTFPRRSRRHNHRRARCTGGTQAGTPASAAGLERENRALRRELQEVRQQRAILRKHWPSSLWTRDEDGRRQPARG